MPDNTDTTLTLETGADTGGGNAAAESTGAAGAGDLTLEADPKPKDEDKPKEEEKKKRGRPKKEPGAAAEYPQEVLYHYPPDGRPGLISQTMWLIAPGQLARTADGEMCFQGARESEVPEAGCYTVPD